MFLKTLMKNKIMFLNILFKRCLSDKKHFMREGRNAWVNRSRKGLFQGVQGEMDEIRI